MTPRSSSCRVRASFVRTALAGCSLAAGASLACQELGVRFAGVGLASGIFSTLGFGLYAGKPGCAGVCCVLVPLVNWPMGSNRPCSSIACGRPNGPPLRPASVALFVEVNSEPGGVKPWEFDCGNDVGVPGVFGALAGCG